MPATVRTAAERHLTALWRCLDGCRLRKILAPGDRCRSEEFELRLQDWRLTYEVDVLAGIAVIRQVARDPIPWLE
jgi:hypothetical protein